jgi:AAA domain
VNNQNIPSRLAHRKQLRESQNFIVDVILPAEEIHGVVGDSGGGKTTWLMPQLYDFTHGKPVLGYESHPCPWVYISCDRSTRATDLTLLRLGLGEWDAPIFAIEDLGLGKDPDLMKIRNLFHLTKLFVIEGLQALIPDPPKGRNQNKHEMLWVAELRQNFLCDGRTIIFTTHSPKLKKGETYTNSRSAMLGSQSLIASCGTLITVEAPAESKDATDERIVTVKPRNVPTFSIAYSRDQDGRFITEKEADAELSVGIRLLAWPIEQILTTDQVREWFGGCYREKSQRWLQEKVKSGELDRIAQGKYRKRPTQ